MTPVALATAISIAALLASCGGDTTTTAGETDRQAEQAAGQASGDAPAFAYVRRFGRKGGERELAAASTVLHAYLLARAKDDAGRACSYMAKDLRESVALTGNRHKSCAEGFEQLNALTFSGERPSTEADTSSLRRRGKRTFVIYTDGAGDPYAMLMRPEEGAWMIAEFGPTPLF